MKKAVAVLACCFALIGSAQETQKWVFGSGINFIDNSATTNNEFLKTKNWNTIPFISSFSVDRKLENNIAIGANSQDLLQKLNDLDFYKASYPKSLGMEFVNAEIFPLMHSYEIDAKDKLRTFVEHIALQIAKICSKPNSKLFVTGGGAYNRFLIDRLRNYLATTEVVIPDDKTIQFKEALIFGFLGVLRLRDEINVLSSVTGASKNHSTGVVFN